MYLNSKSSLNDSLQDGPNEQSQDFQVERVKVSLIFTKWSEDDGKEGEVESVGRLCNITTKRVSFSRR